MNIIGFPGFGIGPFAINPVAFSVFGFDIVWYGMILTLGIVCGILYAFWRAVKSEGISTDAMMDIAIFAIPSAAIGSRIYFILFNLDQFPTFRSMFQLRMAGLAIYGAIIAAVAVTFAVCKFKKLPFLKVLDATAPAIMLGQIIGRWGNFINAEAFGTATDLSWRMSIVGVGEVHPTFLYESLWNLLGFALINLILYRRKKFDSQIFLTYIAWYGFGRMLIEGLRVDSLMLGSFRISQIIGGLCFVGGVILIIWLSARAKIKALENDPEYQNVYSSAIAKISEETKISEEAAQREEQAISNENEKEKDETTEEIDAAESEESQEGGIKTEAEDAKEA